MYHDIFPDRAECFFQAINIGDSPMARASMSQFRSAANALLINCALGSQSQGGIATNIGKLSTFDSSQVAAW